MPDYVVEVVIEERRIYKIEHAQTLNEARGLARERANQDSPLGLDTTQRAITDVVLVGDSFNDGDDDDDVAATTA